MEQLSNEPTQSSAAQPQENHMGLANMTLVPLSEPPSATGSNGSQDSSQKELQDSQRRRSHASQSSPIRSREIIKAINDLTTRVCGAMAESQARSDATIESVVASLAESTKAVAEHVAEMTEARKMAAAQHHANLEKLNAAWAQSHADSEKLNAAIANLAHKLTDKHAKEASEDRAPSTEKQKASEEREIANKAAEERAELMKKQKEALAKLEEEAHF